METRTCRITPEDLAAALEQGRDVLILDVRQPGAYASSPYKLPGAVRVEPDQIEWLYRSLPADRPVVTYCT